MSTIDRLKVSAIPHVSLTDASAQDHSTGDTQFPVVLNDALFLWAMVDHGGHHVARRTTRLVQHHSAARQCGRDRLGYGVAQNRSDGDGESVARQHENGAS